MSKIRVSYDSVPGVCDKGLQHRANRRDLVVADAQFIWEARDITQRGKVRLEADMHLRET